MKKALLASLVIGSGLLMAACSSKQTASATPAMPAKTETALSSTAPATDTVTQTTVVTEDKVAPATKTDSVDDLDKEISSYTIEQEQFN